MVTKGAGGHQGVRGLQGLQNFIIIFISDAVEGWVQTGCMQTDGQRGTSGRYSVWSSPAERGDTRTSSAIKYTFSISLYNGEKIKTLCTAL